MRNNGKKMPEKTLFLPASAAKQYGRTVYHTQSGLLWCSHSGTGIGFFAYGTRCRITLTADSAYCVRGCEARFAVYVNGNLHTKEMLTVRKRTLTLPLSLDGTEIRIVKLSESAHSAIGIGMIRIDASEETAAERQGRLFTPLPEHSRLIEFIGDSITCGYGVDDPCIEHTFTTATEDAEQAYAIRTANLLSADYSLVSFSGFGLLSGYTENGTINTEKLVQPHYEKIGHCPALLEGTRRIDSDLWDFHRRPDLVVINLGTNDESYTGTEPEKQAAFTAAYIPFLHTVRKCNPDAYLLCTLGIMGQTLCGAAENAVKAYIAETGDKKIRYMTFAEQLSADGICANWHPSAVTYGKAAEALAANIRQLLGW